MNAKASAYLFSKQYALGNRRRSSVAFSSPLQLVSLVAACFVTCNIMSQSVKTELFTHSVFNLRLDNVGYGCCGQPTRQPVRMFTFAASHSVPVNFCPPERQSARSLFEKNMRIYKVPMQRDQLIIRP